MPNIGSSGVQGGGNIFVRAQKALQDTKSCKAFETHWGWTFALFNSNDRNREKPINKTTQTTLNLAKTTFGILTLPIVWPGTFLGALAETLVKKIVGDPNFANNPHYIELSNDNDEGPNATSLKTSETSLNIYPSVLGANPDKKDESIQSSSNQSEQLGSSETEESTITNPDPEQSSLDDDPTRSILIESGNPSSSSENTDVSLSSSTTIDATTSNANSSLEIVIQKSSSNNEQLEEFFKHTITKNLNSLTNDERNNPDKIKENITGSLVELKSNTKYAIFNTSIDLVIKEKTYNAYYNSNKCDEIQVCIYSANKGEGSDFNHLLMEKFITTLSNKLNNNSNPIFDSFIKTAVDRTHELAKENKKTDPQKTHDNEVQVKVAIKYDGNLSDNYSSAVDLNSNLPEAQVSDNPSSNGSADKPGHFD